MLPLISTKLGPGPNPEFHNQRQTARALCETKSHAGNSTQQRQFAVAVGARFSAGWLLRLLIGCPLDPPTLFKQSTLLLRQSYHRQDRGLLIG
jgi:hypothetical protein